MVELPKGKGMKCLECSDVVKALKAYNAKIHYQSKHASTYDSLTNSERKTKIQAHEAQQQMINRPTNRNRNAVMASIQISHILSERGKLQFTCMPSLSDQTRPL